MVWIKLQLTSSKSAASTSVKGKEHGTWKFHHFNGNKCTLSVVQNEIIKEWNEGEE